MVYAYHRVNTIVNTQITRGIRQLTIHYNFTGSQITPDLGNMETV